MRSGSQSAVGILACGAYVPKLRLQRSVILAANGRSAANFRSHVNGERSVASWDEDVITMAVEAARDCLTGLERDSVSRLVLASTTAPFADRQNSVIVKEALNLPDHIATFDVSGGQRAGLASLIDAIHACAGGAGTTLCVASEKRKALSGSDAEMTQGHAAAAMCIGPEKALAVPIAVQNTSVDFVDHFRQAGRDFDYAWEARWLRDEGFGQIARNAIRAALDRAGLAPPDIDAFVLPVPAPGIGEAVADSIGIPRASVRDTLAATVGDSGSAHSLLMLAHAIEEARPGQHILVAAFGSGCDVMILRTTDAVAHGSRNRGVAHWLRRRKPLDVYTKYLGFEGLIAMERGMRAEVDRKQSLTALYRHRKSVLGLVGGRCTQTGSVQFPRSAIGVDATDGMNDTQEDYPLAERRARVLTYTADNLAYSPDPPAQYGTIEFEGGGRMSAEFCDVDADEIAVGRAMRMMFRIKNVDERRGFTSYFWKAAPAE